MSAAWRFARRDLRRGGQGLVLLALCLFLGTAALAGIGSLSAAILAGIDAQGRQSLGGDLELRVAQRRATVDEAAAFAAAGRVAEVVSMNAMARSAAGEAALVQLRGVDDRWPLVGRLRLAPGALAARPRGRTIVVAPALAERLGVRVGDPLRLGGATFRIVGLIADEPDRLGTGFSLGPAAIVDLAGLDATALVQPGSLYESRYRIVVPDPARAGVIGQRLVTRFSGAGWSSRTSDGAAAGLRRGIAQLGQFLLLVGLAALAIAGIGVGSGVSAYLAGKTRMIATLKVLGGSAGTIAMVFLLQLGLVAGVGIVAGLAVGAAVPGVVAVLAGAALPVQPKLALYPLPLGVAAALGVLVTLIVALPALARARRVPAATLLRDIDIGATRPSFRVLAASAMLSAALVAVAVLTATDRALAAGFVAAIAALIMLLFVLGRAIRAGVARLPRARGTLLRMAIGNLHRPGAQTDRLVVALGLGFSLFVALAVIDTSLIAELAGAAPAKAPRFFALDLQPDDAARFGAIVAKAAPGARIDAVPSLRGSITAVKDVPVTALHAPSDAAWVLRGDRTLTWAARVPGRNKVVAGHWWPAGYRGPPLISIEDKAAHALGLRIGDAITVSVLGVDIRARIAALRAIDWRGLDLNFAIVFSPGYIEEAPHALLASVHAAPRDDAAIARAVAAALPSVTLVRVGDVLGQIGAVLAQVALAVRIAAGVTVAAGIAVLVGAVAGSGRARRYDAVVLKLLGARSGQVLGAQAIEYALLSAILVAVALAIGSAAGWYVVVHVFAIGFAPDWSVVALTLATAVVVTLAIGLLGGVPALRARPASMLREL